MKIKIVKPKAENVSNGVIFEAIDNYLSKNVYPKSLVVKKFKLQNEKYTRTILDLKKTIKKADETIVNFDKSINKIARDNKRRMDALESEL